MRNSSNIFKFSLILNIFMILYSAYRAKVSNSEWWGYTFIGIVLWTVGLFLATPSQKMPLWYNLNDLLLYPAVFLIGIKALNSGLKSFIIYILVTFAIVEVIIYLIIKQRSGNVTRYIIVYYAVLVCLSWVLYYKYPLVPLTYLLFIMYCISKSEEDIIKSTVSHNKHSNQGNEHGNFPFLSVYAEKR